TSCRCVFDGFAFIVWKSSCINSLIVHNQALDGGGGLYLRSAAGASIVKTTIADNTAAHAGGLYARADGTGSVVIDSSIISNNSATGGNGGGIQFLGVDNAPLIVKNCLISGNTASTAGGALYLDKSRAVISKTTFSNNSATHGG